MSTSTMTASAASSSSSPTKNGTSKTTSTTPTISSLIQSHGDHVPEDKIQYLVHTPYGRGMTKRTRQQDDGTKMREIELLDWQQATNHETTTTTTTSSSEPYNAAAAAQAIQQAATASRNNSNNNNNNIRPRSRPAVLYSCVEFPSVPPVVGDSVMTPYGRGTVTQIQPPSQPRRPNDTTSSNNNNNHTSSHNEVHVVVLSSWRLSNRNRVTCYLQAADCRTIRPKKLYEMNVYEKVEYSAALKVQANQQFGHKHYAQALQLYAQAIDAVRYVQHTKESDNHVRADLLQFMITCSNNAGTCCTQLCTTTTTPATTNNNSNKATTMTPKQQAFYYKQALQYAQNALVLVQALQQGQTRSPRILTILRKDYQLTDAKLFGQWTIKSYLIQARAHLGLLELDEATTSLEQAHQTVQRYTTANETETATTEDAKTRQQLLLNEKEIKTLLAKVKEKKRAVLQKEKQRARAMFGGGGGGGGGTTTTTTKTATTTTTNGSKETTNDTVTAAATAVAPTPTTPSPTRTIPTTAPLNNGSGNGAPPLSRQTQQQQQQYSSSSQQRRVSFNETVQQYPIPHKDDDKAAAAQQAAEDLPWYLDADLILGLTVFGSAALLAAYATSFLVVGKGGASPRR